MEGQTVKYAYIHEETFYNRLSSQRNANTSRRATAAAGATETCFNSCNICMSV